MWVFFLLFPETTNMKSTVCLIDTSEGNSVHAAKYTYSTKFQNFSYFRLVQAYPLIFKPCQ